MGGPGGLAWLRTPALPCPMPPQSVLGTQWQQVGAEEAEVFVLERAVGATVPLTWQDSFLPDGYVPPPTGNPGSWGLLCPQGWGSQED